MKSDYIMDFFGIEITDWQFDVAMNEARVACILGQIFTPRSEAEIRRALGFE